MATGWLPRCLLHPLGGRAARLGGPSTAPAAMFLLVHFAPLARGRSRQSAVLWLMEPQLQGGREGGGGGGRHAVCTSRRHPGAGAEARIAAHAPPPRAPTHFSQAPLRYLVAWNTFWPRSYHLLSSICSFQLR